MKKIIISAILACLPMMTMSQPIVTDSTSRSTTNNTSETTVKSPPLAMQSYEFLVVIDGQPDRVDIQLGHGIEEAQQALQVKYGPQAQITFQLIIPDWINKKHDPYNIPTESQRLQAELEPITEAQIAVQNVVVAAMGFTPGFDAYGKVTLQDAVGYRPFEIYQGQRNIDNPSGRRFLTGADRLHQAMVDQQYGDSK